VHRDLYVVAIQEFAMGKPLDMIPVGMAEKHIEPVD